MPGSFKFLQISSGILKIYAFLVLVLMGAALVGLGFSKEVTGGQLVQVVLNILFTGSISFLILYSLSDIIRLLLKIEARFDKQP